MRATYHIQRRRNNQEAKTSVSGNNPAEKKIVRNFLAKNKQAKTHKFCVLCVLPKYKSSKR